MSENHCNGVYGCFEMERQRSKVVQERSWISSEMFPTENRNSRFGQKGCLLIPPRNRISRVPCSVRKSLFRTVVKEDGGNALGHAYLSRFQTGERCCREKGFLLLLDEWEKTNNWSLSNTITTVYNFGKKTVTATNEKPRLP